MKSCELSGQKQSISSRREVSEKRNHLTGIGKLRISKVLDAAAEARPNLTKPSSFNQLFRTPYSIFHNQFLSRTIISISKAQSRHNECSSKQFQGR